MTAGKGIYSNIISRIAAHIGTRSENAPAENIEAADYDWSDCNHYRRSELEVISSAVACACEPMAERLEKLFHLRPEVALGRFEQVYASSVPECAPLEWILPLNRGQKDSCGFLRIAADSALLWVSRLLGDENYSPSESPRELSELEEALLLDIAGAIAGAFAEAVSSAAPDLAAGESFCGPDDESLKIQPFTDMVVMTFEIKAGEDASSAVIAVPCETLDLLAGIEPARHMPPDQASAIMLNALRSCSLTFKAFLGTGSVAINEMFELKPGDVLVLDTAIDERMQVVVQGRPLCTGTLAQCEGKYAICADGIKEPRKN